MLKTITDELNNLNVPYEFMRWTSDVTDPYVVGEYSEVTVLTEDGSSEYLFILNGFTRGSWLELEQIKDTIKSHFPTAGGFRTSTADGKAVAITYENGFPVPTGEVDLKRIQINLNVKTWEGGL